jgi:ankyrin repeat protein
MIYNYNRFVKLNENVQEWNHKLLVYSKKGNLKGVKKCLENSVNVNCKDKFGQTPLIWSSYNGYLEIVKVLIENDADVNCKDNFDNTPLTLSSIKGHLEIVKVLIENGVDVNCKNDGGWTPLIGASYYGHLQIVKCLIENGADWNMKDKDKKDFMDYLSEENKEIITREYPEEYKEYLFKKDVEKYNL